MLKRPVTRAGATCAALAWALIVLLAGHADAEPFLMPYLELTHPPDGVIPRNAVLVGQLRGTNPDLTDVAVTVAVDGATPVSAALAVARCELSGWPCAVEVRLPALPAGVPVEVVVTSVVGSEVYELFSSEIVDETPPIVPPLSSRSGPASRTGNSGSAKCFSYGADPASDDVGVSGVAFLRSTTGTDTLAIANYGEATAASEETWGECIDRGELGVLDEICFAWIAWDWSGNQGTSELYCRELGRDGSDDEAVDASAWGDVGCGASSAPPSLPALGLALVVAAFALAAGARRCCAGRRRAP